jgi:tetratricopeptide (TPR) repeat protein/TolB-like protein
VPAKFRGVFEAELKRKRRLALAIGAGVLAAGITWIAWKYRQPSEIIRLPTVAVLDFKNLMPAGGTDWVSTALSEGLRYELGAGNHLIPTPGKAIANMMRDIPLSSEASYPTDTIQIIRDRLKCDYVVSGAFTDPGMEAGGKVIVNLRMLNAETGVVMAALEQSGTEQGVPELVMQLGGALRNKIQMAGASAEEIRQIQASIPSKNDARPFYYEGRRQQLAFNPLGARDSFLKGIQADHNFSLAHFELAEVWRGLGYDGKAKDEAEQAFRLSSQLGDDDQSLVKARYQETDYQWGEASKIYVALWVLRRLPDYALLAADAQIRDGKAKEALAALGELRTKLGAAGDSPGIDLKEAEAFEALGDYSKEEQSASKAAEGARLKGARHLEAESLWRACGARANLGNAAGAMNACGISMQIAKSLKDQLLIARNLTVVGNILDAGGKSQESLAKHSEALQIATGLGAKRDVIGALINIGDVEGKLGKNENAKKSYDTALTMATETADSEHIAAISNNLAISSQTAGEFEEANRLYEKTLEAARTSRNRAMEARVLANLAGLDLAQGRLKTARERLSQALSIGKELDLQSDNISFLYSLGDAQLAQGDVTAAKATYE